MKALLSIAAVLFATSAFAATQKIDCDANSDSDQMISIYVDAETSRIRGASIYNVNWSQTAEATYQTAKDIGTINPVKGPRVYLQDGQYLDIDYSILEAGHEGSVKLNSSDDYSCY